MALKLENINNLIADDLAKRNENWTEIDTELSEKVQNFKIKNEVVNGDFSNGTIGWNPSAAVLSTNGGILIATGNGTGTGNISITEARTSTTLQNGKKEYSRVRMRVRDNTAQYIRMRLYAGLSDTTIDIPAQDQWYEVSAIMTGNATTAVTPYIRFVPSAQYGDAATANGKVLEIEKPIIIRLTDIFGVGNEPTKEEMDELMKVIPNQWWDGELSLTQKHVVTWQLNLIRKNTNAIIALGGTII